MDDFYKALEVLIKRIQGVDFALLGTFNLIVQGINVRPHDLDLITDDAGLKKISNIFKSKVVKNNTYLETEFFVNDIEIHVVSNEGNLLHSTFRGNTVWLERNDLRIPCLSLESELAFYQKINREKDKGKIELIQEKLSGEVR